MMEWRVNKYALRNSIGETLAYSVGGREIEAEKTEEEEVEVEEER